MFIKPRSKLADLLRGELGDGLRDFCDGGHARERKGGESERKECYRPSGGQGRGGVARVKSLIVRVRLGL